MTIVTTARPGAPTDTDTTALPFAPYVAPLARRDARTEPRLVRWRMGGPGGDAKIALKALPLVGRAGHVCRAATSDAWNLVVRQFAVAPAGDYVDALWTDPANTGWVFQACCVRSGAERFNELEYHAPAVRSEPGRNRAADESQVWAFRGSAVAIAEAARLLLGAELKLE